MPTKNTRAREVPRHAKRNAASAHPHRMDDGDAFIPDPSEHGGAVTKDDFAESLAEEYVTAATTAESVGQDALDEISPEEFGGPFVEDTAENVFADDVDESNPVDAEPEPFPTAMRVPER